MINSTFEVKNKAIIIINLEGSLASGAEKRFITLFDYIVERRDDYLLIINDRLYNNYKKSNRLKTNKNIHIINLSANRKIDPPRQATKLKYQITVKKNKSRIRVYIGKTKYFLKLFIQWIRFAIQLKSILKANNITHLYGVWYGGVWAYPLRKIFGFTLNYSANSYLFADFETDYFSFFDSDYWVLKYCDKIDFLSPSMVPILETKIGTIDSIRISISPNSFINYDNFFPEYPKSNSVVFLARTFWDKNPILFLQSIEHFNKNNGALPEVMFYMLGSGPMDNDIIDFINKHQLKNVKLIGTVAEPWKYLRKSKVFISIQVGNNYPSQSLLEAMACENAIIASDVGETRLLISEDEGILVDLNAKEIADAIGTLFSNEEQLKIKAQNARKKAIENHNIDRYAEYFYKLNDNA